MSTVVKSLFTTGALARSQFRWFYIGRNVSLFGSGMTPVALAFAILQARHGQHLLGYIMAAEILPNVVMLLLGGSVADRYRRDRLILFASLGSGCTQAGIAAIVLTGTSPYWIFPLAVTNGIISAFSAPATRGIVPELVDRADIQRANALLNASRSTAKMVGPAAAGVLAATIGGGWGIAVDALSFFIASACIAYVRIPSRPTAWPDSLVHQMRAGWAYFSRRPWIWTITGAFAVMNPIQMGAWRVLGPIIALRTFGPADWGVVLSLQAAGLLGASFVMLRVHFTRPLRAAMAAEALVGLPMMVLGIGLRVPCLMAGAIAAGMGSAIADIAWNTSLQQGIPKDKLSRVMAFDDFGSFVGIPIGLVLAIPAAERWGFRTVETASGLAWIIVALLPLALRRVRHLTASDIHAQALDFQDGLTE
ncbi:MFS transporter [Sulfobacillus harzensis]|uniref:MFS transporter n=1 Tax=Sulfobacillus harzensis TaxID=2729629 RepID=A0A7Y0Q1S9_9FIRM|nr:MFS transporter [Sulfobacillus harzensis]NMP21752.1 MFS transporter [Sulfobacillus harzensis]